MARPATSSDRDGRAGKRRSASDWIEAAVQALLSGGPGELRIARLARRLGVTTGSFYWHFRDRDHLRDRVLAHWRDQLLRQAAAAGQMEGRGVARIRALPGILAARRLPELDAAMRAWAREDPVVADGVVLADALRIRVVTAMLKEAGLDDVRAHRRARILWSFALGSSDLEPSERLRAFRDLTEALLHDAGS